MNTVAADQAAEAAAELLYPVDIVAPEVLAWVIKSIAVRI